MRLRNVTRSRNIIDTRRGGRGGGAAAGGIGGVGLILILVIGSVLGVDVMPFLTGQDPTTRSAPQSQAERTLSPAEEEAGDFVAAVLGTTEAVWTEVFPQQVGEAYSPPQLVLFSGATQSACGGASASSGPFYCPADERAYLDTAFFAYMSQRLGAGGDFAAAYVIAHEVAHHIQNELGILGQANRVRAQSDQVTSNRISVQIELQADCLSGIWARNVSDLLERGDLNEALNAAQRIGDDYLQASAGRTPNPHTYTHGTSEQRVRWFQIGYDTGQMAECDTFSAQRL